MACQIAHWCPGYGNPWLLTLGQWRRIIERLEDIQDMARCNLRAANGGDPMMDGALRMARQMKRKGRKHERT